MEFEKKLNRLEEIVTKMESGELSLDKSLEAFEEGVKLSRECHGQLQEAEQKVKLLIDVDESGKVKDKDFKGRRLMARAFEFSEELAVIEDYLSKFFVADGQTSLPEQRLLESVRYSLMSGGKRFRPILSILTAKALGKSYDKVLPFAAAVEFVHTYSLIHDDLPCMDNDDLRRNKPTNHKVYGEAMALLAGDALLTESFHLISTRYSDQPEVACKLSALLGEAIGLRGMVAGQVMDIALLKGECQTNPEYLKKLHALKTGALIRVAIEGAAIACGAQEQQAHLLRSFGVSLGFAFQLADDILDEDPKQPEASGYPALLGVNKTKELLDAESKKALDLLTQIKPQNLGLKNMTEFNLSRQV